LRTVPAVAEQPTPGGEIRRYGRTASLVSFGIGLSGVLLYGFFALASHTLTADEYGDVVVLWLIVFATVSTLFRPVEQLLAREIATARAGGGGETRALRSAAWIAFALAGAFVIVALLAREPLETDVFSGDSFLYWSLLAAVITFAADYYERGVVAGRGRFDLYAAQLVTECAVLVGVGLLGASGIAEGPHAFAAGIAAAPVLGVAALGVVIASGHGLRTGAGAQAGPGSGLARHSGFAAAVLAIMLSEQVLINAGPLFVRAAGDTALAGFTFNVLMVARAPAALFQGIAASLLPHLAGLRARGTEGSDAFAASIRATLAGVAAFTAALALGVLALGPPLMELVFSGKFDYDRGQLVLVALGTGFLLAGSTLTQAALVRGRAAQAALAWGLGALAFCAWNLASPLDPDSTVVSGFLLAAALVAAGLALVYRRGAALGRELEPGSPDEFQARLATAEELG
jgi:O-antigen/teichoic acid export membrane protein